MANDMSGTISKPGDKVTFIYVGYAQAIEIPISGLYHLDCYGARGGNIPAYYNSNGIQAYGGNGGRAQGKIKLKKGQVIYIYCGGVGNYSQNWNGNQGTVVTGGFNGGGGCGLTIETGYRKSSGGGATHVALVNGLLYNLSGQKDKILLVAGGGGGASAVAENSDSSGNPVINNTGGYGGGLSGGDGTHPTTNGMLPGKGASQTAGGSSGYDSGPHDATGAFGKGAGATLRTGSGSGGGGGWYGGGSGGNGNGPSPGGGGSGHIGDLIIPGTEILTPNVQPGSGVVYMTLLEKSVPTMYLGDLPVDALMLGSTEISDMALGNKML